jgi:hypothetical protein
MIALESPEQSYGGKQKEATTVPLQFGRSGEVGWLELNLDTVPSQPYAVQFHRCRSQRC